MRNERINASFFCIFDSFMQSKIRFFVVPPHFGVHILIPFSLYNKSPSSTFLEELLLYFYYASHKQPIYLIFLLSFTLSVLA